MSSRTLAPIAATTLVLVAVLLALFDLAWVVTGILGAALTLVVPGFVLAAALFPRRDLDPAERTLTTLASSIVIAILTGFLLTRVGIRLTPVSWAVSLTLVSVAFGAVALARGWRPVAPTRPAGSTMPPLREALLFGAAGAVVIAAIGLARFGVAAQRQEPFTQLWVAPAAGASVYLGVVNEEGREVTYRVELRAGTAVLRTWSPITVAAGQRWETTLALSQQARTGAEVLLFRADAPGNPYRRVVVPPLVPASPAPTPASAAPTNASSPTRSVSPAGSAPASP